MALKKVHPGEKVRRDAESFNAFVDAANYVKQRQFKGGAVPIKDTPADVVLVYNDTGEHMDRWDAVTAGDPVILPADNEDQFENKLAVKITTPTTGEEGRWLVTLEPIPKKGFGSAVAVGMVQCWVKLKAKSDTYVDVVAGSRIPEGASKGAQILWVKGGVGTADATGEQWAVIRLPGVPLLSVYQGGKADEASKTKLVKSGVAILNMSTVRGTDQILEFVDATINIAGDGEPENIVPCINLQFKEPPSGSVYLRSYQGEIFWDRLKWRDD